MNQLTNMKINDNFLIDIYFFNFSCRYLIICGHRKLFILLDVYYQNEKINYQGAHKSG